VKGALAASQRSQVVLWFVYNVLFAVGYVLLLPRFLLRMWRRGGYRKGFGQRLAIYGSELRRALAADRRVWIHAQRQGEVNVALGFIRELRARRPDAAFILSTNTSTGRRVAEPRLGPQDVLVYFPTDFPPVVRRALRILNPSALLITECELWPNLIRAVSAAGIPLALINGRISESSFRGYRRLRAFFGPVVRCFDVLLVQTEADSDRLQRLGADERRIHVVGTAKYDAAAVPPGGNRVAEGVLRAAGIPEDAPVLLGGSTWPGEEAVLLDIYGRLRASGESVRLVLLPRHAERRAEIAAEVRRRGLACLRRTEIDGREPGSVSGSEEAVLLVDSTGEAMAFYACASVIFMGKSLTARGGQNLIEPAALGKAVIVGPHMENFPVVTADFLKADAIVQVGDAEELERAVRRFLDRPDLRRAFGERAARAVASGRGAVRRSCERIEEWMESASGAGAEPKRDGHQGLS